MSYECLDCNRTFASAVAVQSHARAKGHTVPECEQCDRLFINGDALASHKQNASVHRHKFCAPCNRTFTTSAGYQQHLANSAAHQFECYSDNSSSEPATDAESEAEPEDYGSEDESEDYESEDESEDDESEDDDVHYCQSCKRNFVSNAALIDHLAFNSAHNWCFVCSRDFSSPSALSQHNSSPAHRDKAFKCPFCTNMFKTPSAIAMHIESGCHRINRRQVTAAVHQLRIIPQISIPHRIEGPRAQQTRLITYSANERAFNGIAYECYLCHSTFATLERLNQHLNSPAHDDPEFQCPHCKSQFKLISGLVQHIESESCGIARFNEVKRHFETLTDRFSRLLKF